MIQGMSVVEGRCAVPAVILAADALVIRVQMTIEYIVQRKMNVAIWNVIAASVLTK